MSNKTLKISLYVSKISPFLQLVNSVCVGVGGGGCLFSYSLKCSGDALIRAGALIRENMVHVNVYLIVSLRNTSL